MRRYFSIARGFGEESTAPSNYPYRKDLCKNAKSKFAGLAELSKGNKIMWQTNDLNQRTSLSCVMKLHFWVSCKYQKWVLFFWVEKTNSSFCVDNFHGVTTNSSHSSVVCWFLQKKSFSDNFRFSYIDFQNTSNFRSSFI